jgi:hypothetical protein
MPQLMFNGREVQEGYVNLPGLGEVPIMTLFPDDDMPEWATGDEMQLSLTVCCVNVPGVSEKFDKDGVGIGPTKRVWDFKAVRPGLAVNGVYTRAAKDAAFKAG